MRFAARNALFFVSCLASLFALASCGGGGGGGSSAPAAASTTVATTKANYATVTVGPGVTQQFGNIMTVSVTVCIPGTESCSTVPNVQVDTGSTGLRLLASALDQYANVAGFSESLAPVSTAGGAEAECAQFADGVVWGAVRTAAITIGGLTTTGGEPIQVIGDTTVGATPPTACTNLGTTEDTAADLGANGIIGVGYFLQDCGPTCAATAQYDYYFACTSSTSCSPSLAPLNLQLVNPVAAFAAPYNNGNIIALPAITAAGAPSVAGEIFFGINSATDNAIGSATILGVDPNYGTFTVTFNGSSTSDSFIDSGSSVYFFNDTSIPQCSGTYAGYYCPTTTFTGSATITGPAPYGGAYPFTFSVVNPTTGTLSNSAFAFNDLGAPISSNASSTVGTGFDIGLPYFFGHTVYTGFEDRIVDDVGAGPFAAIGN